MNINAIFAGKKFISSTKTEVKDLKNQIVAEMDNVPSVLVYQIRRNLLKTESQGRSVIAKCLKKATNIFLNEEVDGVTCTEYVKLVHTVTGLPLKSVYKNVLQLVKEIDSLPSDITEEVPKGAHMLEDVNNLRDGNIYWIPKGRILSVIAPGNNPLVHRSWLEALAAGYKILLRPSQKDPFTPYRLIKSLLMAGLSEDMVAFLPGTHNIVNAIVDAGDFSLVFGNKATIDRYNNLKNMILRGPGYSRLYWDDSATLSYEKCAQIIYNSVIDDGGAKCTNISGIIYDSANKYHMEAAIERIAKVDYCGWLDEQGELPLFPTSVAVKFVDYIKQLTSSKLVDSDLFQLNHAIIDLGNGISSIKPIVFRISDFTKEFFDYELPFPTCWVYELKNK